MRFNTLATLPALLILSGFLAGCARFTPLPLPNQAEVLKPPDMARVRVAAAGILHPLLPPIHFDDRDGISPDEAALLAVLLNPKLRAARDERGIAGAQLLQAGLLPNPSLTATWETPASGDTTGTVDGFGIGVEWDIRRLITHAVHRRATVARAEAVDLGITWREWQTAEAAKEGVYRLDFARRRAMIAREMVKALHAQALLVNRALGLGQKTQLDAAAVEAREQEARTLLVEAERNAAAVRLALNRLLGVPPGTRLRFAEAPAVTMHLNLLSRKMLLDDLENRRPDLLALRRGYESQNARLRAAILEQFPRIRIGLTQAKDTDGLGTVTVGGTVELPIFDRGRVRVRLEEATRRQLRDEYAARVFDAVSRIDELLARIKAAEGRIAAATAAVDSLAKLRTVCMEAVRSGRMDVLRATDVSTRLLKRKLERVTLEQQLVKTRIALELLSGRYRVTGVAAVSGNRKGRLNSVAADRPDPTERTNPAGPPHLPQPQPEK